MKRKSKLKIAIATAVFAVLGGMAVYAQDKYSLKSPSGIAFSDFEGYEDWAVVSSARTDEVLKVIVANPTMIEAYKAGVPDNGQPSPRVDCGANLSTECLPLSARCGWHAAPALRTLISAACTATPWRRTISNANFAAAPNVSSGVIVFSWMCAPGAPEIHSRGKSPFIAWLKGIF